MSLMQLGCEPPLLVYPNSSSSSHMHVMTHNWSATKQCPHPQSVAETNHHSVLPEDRIRQRETLPGSHYKDRSVSASCHHNPQAPQCSRCARKRSGRDHCFRGRSESGCRIVGSHTRWDLTTWADFQLCLHRLFMSTGRKSSHSAPPPWMPVAAVVGEGHQVGLTNFNN